MLTATARAQDIPRDAPEDIADTGISADTDFTPVAKQYEGWQRVAGAEFGADHADESSTTTYGTDLYSVVFPFGNDELGFAGGSACAQEPLREEGESLEAFNERVLNCDRGPVIYRYSEFKVADPTVAGGVREVEEWRPETLPLPGAKEPGYVGAIAFIDADHALAVGGTGEYVRREGSAAGMLSYNEWVAADPAGKARAWLWCNPDAPPEGEPCVPGWTEITPTLPAGMRGLTAVTFEPTPDPNLGFAGGLGQIWTWKDGAFKKEVTDLNSVGSFRFRVRAIQFHKDNRALAAFATTAGCCHPDPTLQKPLALTGVEAGWVVTRTDSQVKSAEREASPARPWTYYDFTGPQPSNPGTIAGVLAAPDGLESEAEPDSSLLYTGAPSLGLDTAAWSRNARLSTARLVAFDGKIGSPNNPPQTPRWTVGLLRSTGQALVESTHLAKPGACVSTANLDPSAVVCSAGVEDGGVVRLDPTHLTGEFDVDPEQTRRFVASYNYFKLPAYALNAVEMIEPMGTGWAVGDHGAILKVGDPDADLGTAATTAQQRLPSRKRHDLPSGNAYDSFRRPVAEPAGTVPSMLGRPRTGQPGFLSGGWVDPDAPKSANPISHIAISRDGSEGWALEAKGRPGLYRFDGEVWSRCDAIGVKGQREADAACADARLEVGLMAIARVPLENDRDPTNDDEFEVVAISDKTAASKYLILRYRDGSWIRDGTISHTTVIDQADLAFASPTDGFARATAGESPRIFHYDGEGWDDCSSTDADVKLACGIKQGEEDRLNFGRANLRFTVVDRRIYLWGTRENFIQGQRKSSTPLLLRRDPGGPWVEVLDPGFHGDESWEGKVTGFAAGESDGEYEGWAIATRDSGSVLLHLRGDGVEEWAGDDASTDYLGSQAPGILVGGAGTPFVLDPPTGGPLLTFDEVAQRWRVLPVPFTDELAGSEFLGAGGRIDAMANDRQGGFWAAVRPRRRSSEGVAFQRYTPQLPEPVFEPAPQPLQKSLTALAATPDGQVWAAQSTGRLARYDRVSGWETLSIPGWDTRTTTVAVHGLALGPDGQGIAVGDGARIAQFGSQGVRLDPAAGVVCELPEPKPPCANGDLLAVAIAPEGSAIAAGERMAVNWRPAGKEFHAIGRPADAGPGTTITAVSLPSPDRAYLATDAGQVFEGRLEDGEWRWELANKSGKGGLLSIGADGNSALALNGIAVGPDGHGYAVGDDGLLLERTGAAEHPWQRLDTRQSVDLTSVALPVGGGPGALVGGQAGLVLTLQDGAFHVARPADPYSTPTGDVVDLAIIPGFEPGQAEAWAAQRLATWAADDSSTGSLLHYSSESGEPLLDAKSPRADALADAPPPREGELTLAAFGKIDCTLFVGSQRGPCSQLIGANVFHELVVRGIVEELSTRAGAEAGPRMSLFAGDVAESNVDNASRLQERFVDLVAEPLDAAGAPLWGTVGVSDTAGINKGGSAAWRAAMERRPAPWGTADGELSSGDLTFAPAPGQDADQLADPADDEDLLDPKMVPDGQARTHYAVDVLRHSGDDELPVARLVVLDTSHRSLVASDPYQQPLEPNGLQQGFLERMLCFRGEETATGERCTREPSQQAIVLTNAPTYSYGPGAGEETATDGAVLESILLRYRANLLVAGRIGWQARYWATAPGLHEPCPGDPYQPDFAVPESQGRICGRTADLPVEPEETEVVSNLAESLNPPQATDVQGAAGQLGGNGILPVVVSSTAGGKLAEPRGNAADGNWHGYSIVRLDASGDPRATIVEQRPIFDWVQITGEDRSLIAGERLKLDGVGLEPLAPDKSQFDEIDSYAITHRYELLVADPGQPWLPCEASDEDCRALRSTLAAGPRSLGSASGEAARSARDDIGKCGPYLCLPERVGTIDPVTGEVRAGDGKYPDTFALATLSLGCVPEDESQTSCSTDTPGVHSATYPLVLKKSPSFVVNTAFALPEVPSVPTGGGSAPPPPPPPNPGQPSIPQPNLPQPPPPPTIAALPAAEPPEPQPPALPVPAPPGEQPSPLNLTISPTALTISTPAAVIQPPTPPVNPAPPSGARREARQRQAAAQRSGAGIDADEALEEGADPSEAQHRVNLFDSDSQPATRRAADNDRLAFTRRTRHRPAAGWSAGHSGARPFPSFTPVASAGRPSAWEGGALYSGGLVLAALVLAFGFNTLRGRPGEPQLPAPAWQASRYRR